ncbi:hypothetical protein [Nocardia farcinica]|nr:hypothetical protein [Nocardia farcinica]
MVVSIDDGRLLRVGSSGLEELADLAPVAFHPNDMAVDREGRAYIGPQGFPFGTDPVGVSLIIRHPDGRIDTGGEDLIFPTASRSPATGAPWSSQNRSGHHVPGSPRSP